MLQLSHIVAGYGARAVLRDVSLEVASGQVAAIIGPNGSGKSTLLRCAAGLVVPQSGEVEVVGDNVWTLEPRERARRIALLPQSSSEGEQLSSIEMVLLGRTPHLPPFGAPRPDDIEIARDCLKSVGAEQFLARRVSELSGGERQRVVLARALAQQPRVLLLDEPTSNLDLRFQFEILDLVHRLVREKNIAVVLVLHQINLASQVADKMLLLDGSGCVRAQGTPEAVMTKEHLSSVYEIELDIAAHPQSGRPHAIARYTFG